MRSSLPSAERVPLYGSGVDQHNDSHCMPPLSRSSLPHRVNRRLGDTNAGPKYCPSAAICVHGEAAALPVKHGGCGVAGCPRKLIPDPPVADDQGIRQNAGLIYARVSRLRCCMGSAPQLETVLIEMIVQAADFPAASFDSVAGDCADKSGGRILFNVRVDSHADVQRVAAIASKSDAGVAPLLLLLDRTGTSIKIHEVPVEDYPLVVSIARWANQPLHSQATTSVDVEVTLLLSYRKHGRIS